ATKRPWATDQLCADAGPNVDPRRALRPRTAFRSRCSRAGCVLSAECQDFRAGRQATKPWTRSLSTGVRIRSLLQRGETDSDTTRCSARIAYLGDPPRPPKVARN